MKCLTEFLQLAKNFFSKVADSGVPFFFADPVFHTLQCSVCQPYAFSFGIRLETLKRDYLLVHRQPHHRTERSCTMLHSSLFPLDCVENDSAYFLNCETLCGDLFHTRAMLSSNFSCWHLCFFATVCSLCRIGSRVEHQSNPRAMEKVTVVIEN